MHPGAAPTLLQPPRAPHSSSHGIDRSSTGAQGRGTQPPARLRSRFHPQSPPSTLQHLPGANAAHFVFFFHLSGWNLGAERTRGPGAPVLGLQGPSRSRRAATTPNPHLVWGHRPQTLAAKWLEGCGGGHFEGAPDPPQCADRWDASTRPHMAQTQGPHPKKNGLGEHEGTATGQVRGRF